MRTGRGAITRGHWGLENRNHRVRNVSYDEDRSRIRANPELLPRVRSTAIKMVRKNGVSNVAQALVQRDVPPRV